MGSPPFSLQRLPFRGVTTSGAIQPPKIMFMSPSNTWCEANFLHYKQKLHQSQQAADIVHKPPIQ